jgi:hypothetical protein
VPLPLMAASVWYDSPRPPATGLYEAGPANSGCEKLHSSPFLNSSDDHQSLVGTAPAGAFEVTFCRGLVEMLPQPLGSLAPAGSVSV